MLLLVVDQDADFRSALAENLREDGHEVREYSSPRQIPGLSELDDIAVIIADYQLTGENGLTFADHFHLTHPAFPVVMITAYCTEHLEAEAAAREFLTLLKKPFEYDELLAILQRLASAPA